MEGADDGSVASRVQGVVLSGRSLAPGPLPDRIVFSVRGRGPRDPGNFQETEDRTQALGFGPVQGLVAAPALLFLYFEPENWVRQLDVEIRGSSYDGAVVGWEMGAGISTAAPGQDDDGGRCGALPAIAAIARLPYDAAPRLVSEAVRFEGSVVGTRDYVPDLPGTGADDVPDQLGFVRNEGDAPALITAARQTGPHRGEFDLRLFVDRQPWLRVDWAAAEAAGHVFAVREARRFPILLWPGERIVVGGSFRPLVEGMRWSAVAFETNDRLRGVVSIDIVGMSGPNRAFGYVVVPWRLWRRAVGSSVALPSIVTSDGQTPLVITAIRVEDAGSGFAITGSGARWNAPGGGVQIGPGNTHYFSITFAPTRPGRVVTRVIVESNAGNLTAALEGEGI